MSGAKAARIAELERENDGLRQALRMIANGAAAAADEEPETDRVELLEQEVESLRSTLRRCGGALMHAADIDGGDR